MEFKRVLFRVVVVCLFSFVSVFAKDFSAKVVVMENGKEKSSYMMYVKGKNYRQEINSDGKKSIMILNNDKGVLWVLNVEEKNYLEMPIGAKSEEISKDIKVWNKEISSKAKYLGKDKISGMSCKKYEINNDEGGKVYYWIKDGLIIPLKISYGSTNVVYKNISTKTLSSGLFSIPKGYSKIGIPGLGGALQGLFGGGKGGSIFVK